MSNRRQAITWTNVDWSTMPYGVTRPQWVNCTSDVTIYLLFKNNLYKDWNVKYLSDGVNFSCDNWSCQTSLIIFGLKHCLFHLSEGFNLWPGLHFTTKFSIIIHSQWKFNFTLIQILLKRQPTKFCTWHKSSAVASYAKKIVTIWGPSH